LVTNIFTPYSPISSYDQAELHKQFSRLALVTGGKLNTLGLQPNQPAQILISDLQWKSYSGDIQLLRTWAVQTIIRLHITSSTTGQLLWGNVYGSASGVPLIGGTRLLSNWPVALLTKLLPTTAYWQLAHTQEPFTLRICGSHVSLSVYRFYESNFYLAALDYLADLARRCQDVLDDERPTVCTRLVDLPYNQDKQT